ncbi:cilia- and flagella-associated protein 206 isoform X5 [Festucalex cinctus]
MSRALVETVVETIIRELLHDCTVRGDALSIDMVELSMETLTATCSPSLDTIKMQAYFGMNYTSRREFLKEINWMLESKLNQVSREIIDSRMKTRDQLEVLYRKIITYILLSSGMGSPSDVTSVQETTAALQSIFPSTELGSFMVLLKRDKEQQLSELTMTVTGIRLFNKASKKEHEMNSSELMPAVVGEALSVTSEVIQNELSVTKTLAWKYTALLEKYHGSQPGEYDVPLVQLTQALYNVRQCEHFLQILLAKILSKYPLDSLLEGVEVKTDKDRLNEHSGERIDPAQLKQHEWLHPETTDNLTELPLQYNGFCGYTLVNKDGLLLPGNPYIGVLKHKERLYVFNSKEAAMKFAHSPDYYIALVAEKAKSSPELIKLLKLHQTPFCVQAGKTLLASKSDSGTQTDVHALVTNIVKSYEWNEWELRRSAIKLADLRTTVTHSTQTHLSHMRRENTTQTWLPKEVACQCKRDGETGVPRPQIFLAGLRGRRDGRMEKINLTRSIHE